MMVGSIEPFIRGLYNAAPKCKKCGEVRQYWDDELCIKCRKEEDIRIRDDANKIIKWLMETYYPETVNDWKIFVKSLEEYDG